MAPTIDRNSPSRFSPLCINAHYTGSLRGLGADVLTTYLLGGTPLTVCTSLISAGTGVVTDVLEVPSDSIAAQLEHVAGNAEWNAVRVGIVGTGPAVEVVGRFLSAHPDVPSLLDLTLSGPFGEDIVDARALDSLKGTLSVPDLVSVRRSDAELIVSMEIKSLDDAQVAVQRFEKIGARRVLLRCGSLPARFFEEETDGQPVFSDLFYDGEEFYLFEAPLIEHIKAGGSSLLSLAILRGMAADLSFSESIQMAKAFVSEALRKNLLYDASSAPYFVRQTTWTAETVGQ